jgi:redox-sensitive bicupin YhaK (pirin superfamily)
MITIRRSEERRHIVNSDQNSWSTFDSDNEKDPIGKGFAGLKVFNEEIISPGVGFVLHTHKDMIIITYVQDGMVIYGGPLGTAGFLESGEIHRTSVAKGQESYAFNTSQTDDAHIFQSGFASLATSTQPDDRKKTFTHAERKGKLRLIASPDGKEASLKIQQDVEMYSTLIHKGNHIVHKIGPGRSAWLHVVKGRVLVGEIDLVTGDGAGFSEELSVAFTAQMATEILLFDLA